MNSLLKKVKTMLSATAATTQPTITVEPSRLSGPHIIDANAQSGYLAGQMLVATPVLDSGCFQKSVVYVFAHNADGAMGLILNQPMEMLSYASLMEGMDLPKIAADRDIPVFFGGPVERSRGFVIHSADYYREFSLARGAELSVTASSAILNDILEGNGPKHSALVVGYAGWSAGQLEAEIDANSWITVPATAELMFNTDNELKWATAGKSLGIDIALMSTAVGHA
ncbi:MAG: YqgE/AlgH family protein [Rickettsiales bacterium]